MEKFHRFASLLKIQPGEERLIGYLVLLAFVQDLAVVLLQSMSFGVFLAEYGPQSLPYSYIMVAVFAPLAAVLYIKLGERVSFATSLMLNLSMLGVLNLVVWLGLKSPFFHTVAFILPLLEQIVVGLGYLVIWQLAGRVFNFGQAKRLIPLITAGGWLSSILGGLLVLPLVEWMGTVDLLLPSTLLIGLNVLILRTITVTHLNQKPSTSRSRNTISASKRSPGFLQNRYVLLIFAYGVLWWIAFFFLDNIFADRATAQFPDVNQLTVFQGQLSAITGIFAVFSSTFLANRVIGRFGLRAGLLTESLTVTMAVGMLAISGSLGGSMALGFALVNLGKVINTGLGSTLSGAAHLILYQPLPDTVRERAQATADGILQPVAGGVAGLSLLALTTGLGFNYVGLSYVYLGLATGLLIVIFLLSGSYVNALTQAITKRRLGESPTVLADPASLALLQGRLHDPHPGAAIYALTRLDDLDPKTVLSVLPELIQHPAPEVRREAFARIEKLKLFSSLDAVLRQSSLETVPSVKEYALRALGAISDPTSISLLSDALAGTEVHSLRGALVGSLKYHELPAAEQALDRLLTSPVASDRILAAQALADAERSQFHQSFLTLLRDPDPLVRREALQSASKSRQPDLFPFLIQACDAPETSLAAGQALITIGVDVFPEVEAAFSQPDAPRQRLLTLARVIGRFGGPRAQALLRSRIDSHDDQLRSHILRALSDGGFRQKDKSATFSAIRSEIDRAAWVCAAHADLGDSDQTALLSAALRQSIAQSRERVLLLLSFAFDAHSILRVREAWLTGQSSQLAYALEIIDAQLPADWKPAILPLLEDLSPQDQLLRLAPIFPQARQSTQERLLALIDGSNARQPTHWVRACAIFTAARLSARSCYDAIRLASTHSDPLIRDTARRALAILSSHPQEGNTLMLSTIEKVLILKTVDMFNQTPDDVLADVADLLQEMEVADGETVFKEGDLGDSLYVIVDGRVRVHNDERLLNYLGERDVFGEMALLDPEPRLASVTALEPTRLLRLDQSPFYQLIAERPEVATGIIRVLTRRLRDRVRDISLLDNHVKQLQLASN